jgi:hypothetical protein
MNPAYEQAARTYLLDLYAGPGKSGPVADEEVRRLAALIARAVAEERAACAAIADEIMNLRGSEAAEIIATRIRARSHGEVG